MNSKKNIRVVSVLCDSPRWRMVGSSGSVGVVYAELYKNDDSKFFCSFYDGIDLVFESVSEAWNHLMIKINSIPGA